MFFDIGNNLGMQLTVRVILITLQLQGAAAAGAAGAAGAAAGAARASTTGELIRKTRLYTPGAEKRQTHCAIHHVGSLLPRDMEKPSNQFSTGSDHNGRPQLALLQTATASARLQIRVPRKGTLICRRGTRSQNGLRQASKILLGSRSGSGPYG